MSQKIENIRIKNENLCKSDNECKNKKEWINILDRYLLNYFNYPNNNKANIQKAKSECIEKGLSPHLVDFIIHPPIKFNKDDFELIPKNIVDENQQILKKKYPKVSIKNINECIYVYYNVGIGGQQWSTTDAFKKALQIKKVYNPKFVDFVEAFASPLNHTFQKYFSLFTEDANFNSLGNFFLNTNFDIPIYVNPPFTPELLLKTAKTVIQYKTFLLITPTWSDSDWYRFLIQNNIDKLVVGKGQFKYVNNGTEIMPFFETTIWYRNVKFDKNL